MPADARPDDKGPLTVRVHDEDAGGPPLVFTPGPGEKVSKTIDDLYRELNAPAQPNDRLLCMATGEPVAPHANLHMREYAATLCGDLVWTFARDTGGA